MPIDIRFADEYRTELRAVVDYLFGSSPAAAERFAEAHDRAIRQLLQFPKSGMEEDAEFRSIRVSGSEYRIVYRFVDRVLYITDLSNPRRDQPGASSFHAE